MKIALVCNTSFGMIKFRKGLLQALVDRKISVLVLAPEDEFSEDIVALGCRYQPISISNEGSNPARDLKLCWGLRQLYAAESPDLVIHYTIKPVIYGSIAAKLAGVPSLSVVTGLGYAFLHNNLVTKIARSMYRVALMHPKEVWFINDDDQREFLSRGLVDSRRVRAIPGEGVDLEHFRCCQKPKAASNISFLLVARMLRDKGVREFVAAARAIRRRHPLAKFSLLGFLDVKNPEAISTEQMDEWVAEGVVTYLGASSDVRPWLERATCVVLPSYREGLSMTLLEAAAMGRPMVASDVPGCREIVRDGVNGFLCKPRDSESLELAMERMISVERSVLAQFSRRSREIVETNFDQKYVIDAYLKAIHSIASS